MNKEEKKAIERFKYCTGYFVLDKESSKTILNLIEKLQKENEELKNKIMEKDLEIIGKEEYIKESMGEIIEHYYTANEDCIPVSLVEETIEELGNMTLLTVAQRQEVSYAIAVLQELLEKRK